MTDYSATSYSDHYTITGAYDSSHVISFAPGSTATKDNSNLNVENSALVNNKGFILHSSGTSNLTPGINNSAAKEGPDMTLIANSEMVYVGDTPMRVDNDSDTVPPFKNVQTLAVDVTNRGNKNGDSDMKSKRSDPLHEESIVDELNNYAERLLKSNGADQAAHQGIMKLARTHPKFSVPLLIKLLETSQLIVPLTKRQKSYPLRKEPHFNDTQLFSRVSSHSAGVRNSLLSALSTSGDETAHNKLGKLNHLFYYVKQL